MIPDLDTNIRHAGTITTEATTFSLEETAAVHLMSLLTDLYSKPDLAVVREYSTNALDAHIAAGNPDPIWVTLPTPLAPTFTVQDYGVGMSVAELQGQYSKYGWSSKRETNDLSGTLGLGCKAGLTYTSQFVIVSVKDGKKATVLVTRNHEGVGTLNVVSITETNEHNGVSVQVPVRFIKPFNEAAMEFFSFWDEGTVLVNGQAPKSVWSSQDVLRLDDDVLVAEAYSDDSHRVSRVVMGNVAYPVSLPVPNCMSTEFVVIARVPMGSVTFPPSREALSETARTKDTVRTITDFVAARLRVVLQERIESAPTPAEAVRRLGQWRTLAKGIKYRGDHLPVYIYHPHIRFRLYGGINHHSRLTVGDGQSTLFVTDYTNRTVTDLFRDSVAAHLRASGKKFDDIIAADTEFWHPWMEPECVVTYEEIKIKRQRTKPVRRPQWRLYETSVCSTWVDSLDKVDLTNACWVSAVDVDNNRLGLLKGVCQPPPSIFVLQKGRERKLHAVAPSVPHVDDFIATRMPAIVDRAQVRDACTITHLVCLRAEEVKDPWLHTFIGGRRNRLALAQNANSLLALPGRLVQDPSPDIIGRYPLLASSYPTPRTKDILKYLNDTYTADQLKETAP